MTPLGSLLIGLWPYLAAFLVGWLVPLRRSRAERLGVAISAVLGVALIGGLWPTAAPAGLGAAPPAEWPHLLNVLIFLPILGAIGLLFLPRQAPQVLRAITLGVLAIDFVASLVLLRVPMTAGWHFQYSRFCQYNPPSLPGRESTG